MAKATAKARDSSQEIFIGPGVFERTSHRAEIRPTSNLGSRACRRNAAKTADSGGAAAGWDEAGGWDGAGCATAGPAPRMSKSSRGRHKEAGGKEIPIIVKANTPRGPVDPDYFFFCFDFVAFTIASHGV